MKKMYKVYILLIIKITDDKPYCSIIPEKYYDKKKNNLKGNLKINVINLLKKNLKINIYCHQ